MSNLQTNHITTGTYFIGEKQPLILEVFLGTCVGVAMYDTEAEVGGLIHLMLPEPFLPDSTYMPEKYASNGLPLFISALYDAGATRENLKAVIAGGAFVGHITNQDFDFDIGGRTFDIVKRILVEEKIHIEKTETGGFFSCKLTLNMENWEYNINPSGVERLSGDINISKPSSADIEETIEHIQPIPQVALKVLRLIGQNDYDIANIALEIQKDQVISAKTLQLCNSAIFARKKRIDTIEHALVYIGKDILLRLVINAALNSFFEQSNTGYSLCKGGMFHHAVGTALIAEKISVFTNKSSPSLAYTAGLLHDIGKVVLDRYIFSSYALFYRGMEEKINMIELEDKFFGINHTRAGEILAEKWSFPQVLTEAIRFHHNPEKSLKNPELTHLVYLADLLMSRFHTGLEIELMNTENLNMRLEILGFSLSDFFEIVDFIPAEVFKSPEFVFGGQ